MTIPPEAKVPPELQTHVARLLADELPVTELPQDPRWRENFCFDGYDSSSGIGWWVHCGRWPADPSLWREQVLFSLPDGTFLLHRGWGFRSSSDGPRGALLDLVCEEPGRRWRLRYHGPARRTAAAELHAGTLAESTQSLLSVDLTFTSTRSLWDMGSLHGQDWANFHKEQTGRATGLVSYREGGAAPRSVPVDAFAWRDHSRGARDLSTMTRHCWIHGDLPGGRAFAFADVEHAHPTGTRTRFSQAAVWDGDTVYEATVDEPPYLESVETPPRQYEMTLRSPVGDFVLSAETRYSMPHSTMPGGDSVDGVARGLGHVVTYEQGTVFTVDGGRFDGHSERSHRLHP